jgi:hypothetical protein
MSDANVEATIALFKPYEKVIPSLDPKYYKRPPVKFLAMTVAGVSKQTGFAAGVFTDEQLKGNLPERDDKLKFFDDLKKYTEIVSGQPVDVDSTQIAAGKEMDKTLLFMQAFVRAAEKPSVPFDAALARFKGGDAPPAAAAAAKPAAKPKPAGSPVEATIALFRPYEKAIPSLEPKYFERPPVKFLALTVAGVSRQTGFAAGVFTDDQLKGNLPDREDKLKFFDDLKKYTEIVSGQAVDVDSKDIAAGKEVEKTLLFMQAFVRAAEKPAVAFDAALARFKGGDAAAAKPAAKPKAAAKPPDDDAAEEKPKPAAKPKQPAKDDADEKPAPKPKPEAKPKPAAKREPDAEVEDATGDGGAKKVARKAPPKVRDEASVVVDVAAPKIIQEVVDDDADDVFVEEDGRGAGAVGSGEDGKLVQDILDVVRQMGTDGKEKGGGDDDRFRHGIELARGFLQAVARSAQPLDTLIQFSQEDLGNMENEYKRWTIECDRQQAALDQERRTSEQQLAELNSKIDELDKEVLRQETKLRSVKASAFLKENDLLKQFIGLCGTGA